MHPSEDGSAPNVLVLQPASSDPVDPRRRPSEEEVRMRSDDPSGADDAALALRAAGGDPSAFADLLRRHGEALRRTALRYTRDAADADDAVQEAVWKAWRSLDSLREPAHVRHWLLKIVVREAIAAVGARRHDHELTEDAASAHGPDHSVDRFDLHAGILDALRAMPEQQARTWVLRQLHGLGYREIADRLGAPESSVRGWLVLARKRVQRSIDECCPTARPRPVSVVLPVGGDVPPVVEPEVRPVAAVPAPVLRPPRARAPHEPAPARTPVRRAYPGTPVTGAEPA
jgi:RNA polymerase sigma-70 factor, ECF subfamily